MEEGVEVCILYDGMIEIIKLFFDYMKWFEKIGIKVKVFFLIFFFILIYYNYCDYWKIVVIDGVVGMIGGVNLVDEYINYIELFGYWKDLGIMLKGKVVDSFFLFFL